jgi:tryptophan-rich sensory protein
MKELDKAQVTRGEWYESLNRSPLSPPGWVFGLVWPILDIHSNSKITDNGE